MKGIFQRMMLSASIVLGGSCLLSLSTQAVAAPAINIQNVLQQERTWAGLSTKKVKVGEIDWAYSEGGPSNKPVIVLLHGLSGSRDNWNRVARYLTPSYRVIIPDLPGQGDSKVPADFDYSIPNLTEKLRRFAEAIQIDKGFHIAGHSMGGSIALLYTAQYPLETKSMLLVNSAGVYQSANTPYLKDPSLLKNFIVAKPGDFDRVLKLATQLPPFIPSELKVEQEKLMISNVANNTRLVDQLIVMSKTFTPDSFAIAARSIDQPTLIIWGDKDQIINVEAANELKGLLKNAQPPVILSGVGHTPILEQEQLVAQHYLKFLQNKK